MGHFAVGLLDGVWAWDWEVGCGAGEGGWWIAEVGGAFVVAEGLR